MYVLELAGQDDAFAAYEAESATEGIERVAPGLATATRLTDRVDSLAFTRRVSEVVARASPDVESARSSLESVSLDRSGTIAVRARALRGSEVDTRRVERALGSVLVERGFSVDLDDPDHELRALFSGDVCLLGWLVAVTTRGYGGRRPTDRPFFQPGSMDPMLARALVNVAGAREGTTVLDPMCGTGGLLVEAGLVGADVVGLDAQGKMVRGTRQNLAHFLDRTGFEVVRGDATGLPFSDGTFDAAVFDVPYGRQSKIAHTDLRELVSGSIAEVRRLAPRAVVVADRSWSAIAQDAGWTVTATFERRVHGSLTRHVHVLDGARA